MRRFFSLLLSSLLIFSVSCGARSASRPEGVIRVLLSEHQDSEQLSIGVYGSYLLNGQLSFQSGAELKLSSSSGIILVYYEGAVYRAGDRLRLIRHSMPEGQENGLRLDGSLKLMEGDLDVTIERGKLRPVLTIGIEDYLKGVVPYEMSDSFPLEALKAQAIAARTYALKSVRDDRDFDVYSSTMDQVYLGLDTEHQNALKAVAETAGIVLRYGSKLADCYYTASNGGQTESAINAWGREAIPYLTVKDDPYDAENPMSIWKSYRLPKRGAQLDPALKEMLIAGLVPRLLAMGHQVKPEELAIEQVLGLTAGEPRFHAPSRLMTRLSFQLMVSGLASDEAEVSLFTVKGQEANPLVVQPETPAVALRLRSVSVSLPIFPALEQLMKLSINVKENETVQVFEQADAFEIRFGRYGHGVGMSQRGAEWMAKQHGKRYQDILSFYYPGTVEQKLAYRPATLSALDQAYLTTPGPKPTATPRPTLIPLNTTPGPGQWIVEVRGIAQQSSLNLREEPSLSSKVIQPLYYAQRLLVLQETPDGWLQVSAEGIQGFVMASYTQRVP